LALVAIGLITGCETNGMSYREHPGVTYPNYILSLQPKSPRWRRKNPHAIHLAVAQVGESAPAQAMLKKLEADPTLVASVVALPLRVTRNTTRIPTRRFRGTPTIRLSARSIGGRGLYLRHRRQY